MKVLDPRKAKTFEVIRCEICGLFTTNAHNNRLRARPIRHHIVPITVEPTAADVMIAHTGARNIEPAPEEVARALTWGADERVLLALAAVGGLARVAEATWRAGNHALPVTVVASLLPHGLKAVFNQTRPELSLRL